MDFLQKIRRSCSLEPRTRRTTNHSHKESVLPQQNTFEYYRLKYEATYHPLIKKSKLLGYKSTRWFKLNNGSFIYLRKKRNKEPTSIFAPHSLNIYEVKPIIEGYNFCVMVQREKGSPFWIHCRFENEKNFILDYLSQTHTQHNKTSRHEHVTRNNMRMEHSRVEDEDPIATVFEDIGLMNTEENIAAEVQSTGQFTVEKKIQMYQRASPKRGNIQGPIQSQNGLTRPSIENLQSEEGMENDIPVLPSVKRIGLIYGEDLASCISPGKRPSPRLNLDGLPKARNHSAMLSDRFIVDFCPTTTRKSHKEENKIPSIADGLQEEKEGEENPRGSKFIMRKNNKNGSGVCSKSIDEGRQSKRSSCLTRKMSLPRGLPRSKYLISDYSFQDISFSHIKGQSPVNYGKTFEEMNEKEEIKQNGGYVMQVKKRRSRPSLFNKKKGSQKGKKDFRDLLDLNLKQVDSVEKCIEIGYKLLWRHEIPKAKECFALYKEKSLLLQLLECECDLQEACLSGLEIKVRQALNQLNELSIKLNNETCSFKEDLNKCFELELNKAEAYLAKCILHCFLGNKFQAIKIITDAWRIYRKLENQLKKKELILALNNLNFHRFKFGQGCFAITFSLFSSSLLRLGKLIGIKYDQAEGIKMLEECRMEKNIRSHYAAIFLSIYKLEILGTFEEASCIITDGLRESQGNGLFYWLGSLVCWKYTKIEDSYFMIKTALMRLGEKAETATYFKFELGLHYFLKSQWQTALEIFKGIAAQCFTKKFLASQVSETETLAKSMKIPLEINFSKVYETFKDVSAENMCIFPSPIQLCMKIACCYFSMNQQDLGMKWLLTIIIIHKKHFSIQSKIEDEFYQLSLKYLNKTSMRMLSYETCYFLKHFPRLPDEILQNIIQELTTFRESLSGQLRNKTSKDYHTILSDFISSTLIIIVSNCLVGETEIACSIYEEAKPFLYKFPDKFDYLLHHIEYWVGRALIEDHRLDEARDILKASLKKKKCNLNITHKVKQVLAGISSDE